MRESLPCQVYFEQRLVGGGPYGFAFGSGLGRGDGVMGGPLPVQADGGGRARQPGRQRAENPTNL